MREVCVKGRLTDQVIRVYVGEEELVCSHHGALTLQTVEPARGKLAGTSH